MPLFMDTHHKVDGLTAEALVPGTRTRSRGAGQVQGELHQGVVR